jgi:hypothetical protein
VSTDLIEPSTRAIPRRGALALLGGGVVGLAAAQQSEAASRRHRGSRWSLAGTWDLMVRFPDGLENPTLIQFSPPGSLVETNALTRSTGLGDWKRESKKRYTYRFWEHIFDEAGALTNYVRVEHEVRVSKDGATYAGTGVGYVYDLDWKLTQKVDTTLAARRLTT